MKRGIATMPLDSGKVPQWLFERMRRLTRNIVIAIVEEYGPDEFIKRIADPVWFQCLSCVIGMDWNSSGTTTITTGALKDGLRGLERDLGIFICGGKGKTSRKTPDEIQNWGEYLSLPEEKINNLVYNSKMAAKVDSSLVQDSYQIYHHTFFFSINGSWAVVQQGMRTDNQTARRYHWYSEKITDLVCEPHSGIISQIKSSTLDLTARKSEETRKISTQLVQNNYQSLMKDLQILAKHSNSLSKMMEVKFGQQQFKFLKLENTEFTFHPVLLENFFESQYLKKIFWKLCQEKPEDYEKLVAKEGVGPKTIRALALVAEIIYGAKPSYEDPARYSFAHGGKDATPFPVDRKTYDETIRFFENIISKTRLPVSEKQKIFERTKKLKIKE
jgi:hypothetical protein